MIISNTTPLFYRTHPELFGVTYQSPTACSNTPTSTTVSQADPLPRSFWTYLSAAAATAAVAAAVFFACPPAITIPVAIAFWLFSTSVIMLLNHLVKESNHSAAQAFRWLHATIIEMNCSIATALLFPLTHFPKFHEPQGDPNGRPILMINGYLGFGATWQYLRQQLADKGCGPIYTMNIGSFDSIPHYAAQVRKEVQKIHEQTGRSDIALICHSKGGLVGSYYATQMAPADEIRVTDIVTIGSPLAGTPVARLGIGKDAEEMLPDHSFNVKLRKKIARHSEIRFFNIASETDSVVPVRSALFGEDGSRQRVFKDLGHLGMIFSSKTADQVFNWLKS